jgi:hypothetical protein
MILKGKKEENIPPWVKRGKKFHLRVSDGS